MKLLFSNFFLSGKTLVFTVVKPFDEVLKCGERPIWLRNGTEFRTSNINFDADTMADFTGFNDNSEDSNDTNKTFNANDSDKIKFIKWLAIILNTRYSKEVGLFFESYS